MRGSAYLTALVFTAWLLPQNAAAQPSQAQVNLWLHSTARIELTRGKLPAGETATVASVRGTGVSGFIGRPQDALDGHLANGQEIMVLPLVSGGSGGIFYALLFTRLRSDISFVGYLRSNGHLFIFLSHGTLHIVRPVYGLNDAQCCPSKHDYQIATLHGTHLFVLKHWIAPSLRSR